MPALDLSGIPVVDNHCHPIVADQRFPGESAWRRIFSEAADPAVREGHVPYTVFYSRLIRAMARFHGCRPDEREVLQARAACEAPVLLGRLGREARIDTLVIDTGYPAGPHVLPNRTFADSFGSRFVELLRLELLFQELVRTHVSLDDVRAALHSRLADVRASGFRGLKSIVGYRTGLDVRPWPDADVNEAFRDARLEVQEKGSVRLGYKPLLDTLLLDALHLASAQRLPVQFHVGYGDPDVDLRQATPLHLRALIEAHAFAGVQFVLLHACWPYFREGAFLATVYPNVYLDLSYAIPFFAFNEYVTATRLAVSVAPWTRVMFSSDAGHVPELHWMGASDGRRAIGEAMGHLVHDGDLTVGEALQAAEAILHANARRVYELA